MSAVVSAELWDRWIELWNGNLDLAEHIIHPTSRSTGSRCRTSPKDSAVVTLWSNGSSVRPRGRPANPSTGRAASLADSRVGMPRSTR